jgi:hypothetical protein
VIQELKATAYSENKRHNLALAIALYGQVAGELGEQFDVTLSQMDGTALLLPPFAWSLAG